MTVYNMPNYATANMDIGQGKFYIGTDGASPRDDVGAIKAHSFQLNQDVVEMEQGVPMTKIHQFVIRQSGTVSVEMAEVDIANLHYALGNGVAGTCDGVQVEQWGGSSSLNSLTGKIVHTNPIGGCQWQFKFWRMQVMDLPEIPFTPDDYRTLNVTFALLDSATVWSGDTATSGGTGNGRYCWIEVHPAAAAETD